MTIPNQHGDDQLPHGGLSDDPQTIQDALKTCRWAAAQTKTETHILDLPGGVAKLTFLEERAGCSRFQLTSPRLTQPRRNSVLSCNTDLELPAKYVSGPQRGAKCVVDIPQGGLAEPHTQADCLTHNSNPPLAWAHGLTGALTEQRSKLRHAPLEQVASSLNQLRWSVTQQDQLLEVHIQRPNIYRRLVIEPNEIGYRVGTDLIQLDELTSPSARAVRHLALEANRRLPLVRFSEAVMSEPPQLRAEIVLRVALVPDVWLELALQAVEVAVDRTARELLALRDQELASIFLAEQANAR